MRTQAQAGGEIHAEGHNVVTWIGVFSGWNTGTPMNPFCGKIQQCVS